MRMPFGSIPSEFVSEAKIYDFKQPLVEAISNVNKMGAVIVTKEGKYYGIVDARAATRAGLKLDKNFPVGKVAKQAPQLNEESDIEKAISLFYSSSTKALPFMRSGRVAGMVKRTAIIKAILSMHLLSDVKVNDIMTTPVIAIDQDTGLERARVSLREHRVNRLLVLDHGRLLGILTSKNFMEYGMANKKKLLQLEVPRRNVNAGDVCERNIHTIAYGNSAEDAIRQFVERDISSLPVIRNGKPVGIVTVHDIFEIIVKNANVQSRNIVISGLDENTREYEEDTLTALEGFARKVEHFTGVRIDYIALNVKRIKMKEYELRARMGFVRGGAVSMHVSGYSLEATLNALMAKMLKAVRNKNDVLLTGRKL